MLLAVLVAGCSGGDPADPVDPVDPGGSSPTASTTAEPTDDPPSVTIGLEQVATGLTTPVGIVSPPAEPERVFVVDAVGVVSEIGPEQALTTFLDLRDKVLDLSPDRTDDRGLLGLAFHPDYAANGRAFVFYTAPPRASGQDHVNVLSELSALPDRSGLDPASEQVLLEVPQVFAVHSGGQLLFDQTGALLVFVGDGGDPNVNAQDPATLLGKVLRLDVDTQPGAAAAAADNPPIEGGRPEVYALGLRHPWRVSADPETDRVLMSEPAPGRFQEVNALAPAANYGWPLPMPAFCLPLPGDATTPACVTGPDGQDLTVAVAEYGPGLGDIVSGAHVYRGTAVPALDGLLVVSEWGQDAGTGQIVGGRVHVADATGDPPWTVVETDFAPAFGRALIWGLDADGTGELYLLVMSGLASVEGDGSVLKIVPAT